MPKYTIAAIVLINTDDPALDPDTIDVSTVEAAAGLRAAVIANLQNVSRLIAVMSEDEARMMMWTHDVALRAAGGEINRPPPEYRAPEDER